MKRETAIGLVLSLAAFPLACGSTPVGGGGGGGGGPMEGDDLGDTVGNTNDSGDSSDDGTAQAPDGIVDSGGFFGPTEVWSAATGGMLVAGYGTTIEYVLTALADGNTRCLGFGPPSTVAFDGQQLQISTNFTGVESGDACAVNFTADAADCAPSAGAPPNPCTLGGTTGSLAIGADSRSIEMPEIIRFPECSNELTSSLLVDEWVVSNVHPLSLLLINDPGAVGAVIVLGGRRQNMESANVLTGLEGDTPTGCFDATSQGSVNFDGQSLTVQLDIQGGCSVTFEGTMVYCSNLDPAAFGGTGENTIVIRIEGSGSYTSPEGDGTTDVMYFSYQESAQVPVRQ